MKLNVSRGARDRAQRLIVYGPEGIGKTTFASKMPAPLFIDLEDGSDHMDVSRVDPSPTNWPDLLANVEAFAEQGGGAGFKTIVIDSLDKAEAMLNAYVCQKNGWRSIEDAGYGKGYTRAGEEWGNLLKSLDKVMRAGMNVVLVGHAIMRKQELPEESGAFDRWELQLRGKTIGSPTKEWADAQLFINYKTTVTQSADNKLVKKAKGKRRMVYATHEPTCDAKNRWDLPATFALDDALALVLPHMAGAPGPVPKPARPEKAGKGQAPKSSATKKGSPSRLEELKRLCDERGISETELRQACAKRKRAVFETPVDDYSDDLVAFVIDKIDQVEQVVKEIRSVKNPDVPF